jgi:hypothetical protein
VVFFPIDFYTVSAFLLVFSVIQGVVFEVSLFHLQDILTRRSDFTYNAV